MKANLKFGINIYRLVRSNYYLERTSCVIGTHGCGQAKIWFAFALVTSP